MNRPKPRRRSKIERYELHRSPLAQKPTQKALAELLGLKRDKLRALATYKEAYIVRRTELIGHKVRDLAYPKGELRTVHEKLKFHLNKVKQPDYLISPRTGMSQRENARIHLGQRQYFSFDLKQFYPSTTRTHVFNWLKRRLNMLDDVAGLAAQLVTVDDIVSFGSPLTPVLCSLVHRQMFDAIASQCAKRGLRISLWVDDVVISGNFVPGVLVSEIRQIVRSNGLRTHKLEYRTGNRPVTITGLLVHRGRVDAPLSLHRRIQAGYLEVRRAPDGDTSQIDQLLSSLGSYRYIVGPKTARGVKASAKMAALRRRRIAATRRPASSLDAGLAIAAEDVPFDLD